MGRKKLLFFTFLLYLLAFTNSFSQKVELKIKANPQKDSILINKYSYKKNHLDSINASKELIKYSTNLKRNGYFLNRFDSIIKKNNKRIAYITFGERVNFAKLIFGDKVLIIKISELEDKLSSLSSKFEEKGNSFTKLSLKQIEVKNDTLLANLEIYQSKKRKVDKVIIKGYDDFPKSFLKNYLKLNKNLIFNKKKLTNISNQIRTLDFVEEIKKPEVLFTKDSTIIYMYVKKNSNNSFDGLVNFATQENGSVDFNGYLDLKLNNILNKGEDFNLKWNSFGNERQELELKTKFPYVFKSKISPEIKFSVYKQDSTFLNSLFNIKINYAINNNSELSLQINNEVSEKLAPINSDSNLESFTSFSTGIGYQYNYKKNFFLRESKLDFNIASSLGNRNSQNKTKRQLKIESTIKYLLDLSDRSFIFLKNKLGILNSEDYLTNELFRIGGPNTIRGYTIQSIFSKNYTTQTIEFRYLTSQKSYLYSISDFAIIESINKKEKLLALGLGYLFNTKSSQINISIAIPNNLKNSNTLKNTQLLINWINFF
ncbi:hypothetical protein [Polaribacter sp.]|uniref:hypothetical protein n=1 Tax=Polaribacter sp. TaxID=1920175 RepID=UPI003F6B040E